MNHEHYMSIAFELAQLGLGHTSPNPLSGALLVLNDEIIGRGYHQKYGSALAHMKAIMDAKDGAISLVGATLYCNLEPTDHIQEIIQESIATVVISNLDPRSKGLALETLRSHGIAVIHGVAAEQGLVLNEVYFKFITANRPFVHLKKNQSLTQLLRQKYDCVLVDRETIEKDDPSLCVIAGEGMQPLRIVLGSLEKINHDWLILKDQYKRNTMMVSTDEDVRNHPEVVRYLETQGVALLSVKANELGQVDLWALMKSLASLKFTSILLEGSESLNLEFLNAKLVDKQD